MRHLFQEPGLRRETATFLRFCVVGGGGFLADAGILLLGVSVLHLDPVYARAISAPISVLFTYVLNRVWAFSHFDQKPFGRSLTVYVITQALGFACNFAAYIAVLRAFAGVTPLPALAVGSAVGLAVNYAGARLLAFDDSRKT